MAMQNVKLTPDYEISRIIRGGWQLSAGHGAAMSRDPIEDMIAFADAGVTAFDCADIYTGVEEMIGRFRLRYLAARGKEALQRVHIHTKFVPDLDILPRIAKPDVERVVDRSLSRLKMDRLDLVQLHWWDYDIPGWLETAHWLEELRQAGKIRLLGGVNFDPEHMRSIVRGGAPMVSMQVQYSLLDRRPEKTMVEAATSLGVRLLCYGAVAGGFLSDRWLGAAPPQGALQNRSLVKYRLIIEEFGGWDLLQALLAALREIADRHGCDIATVASAAILGKPGVAAVIVGARDRAHLEANIGISRLRLAAGDLALIDRVLADAKPLPGEVYELERDRAGRHGAIMKYNLNKEVA
jgi:aryl-alcohol dehydrogenase-like predicted oxidoreductase